MFDIVICALLSFHGQIYSNALRIFKSVRILRLYYISLNETFNFTRTYFVACNANAIVKAIKTYETINFNKGGFIKHLHGAINDGSYKILCG